MWRKRQGTIGKNKLRGTNDKEKEKLDFSRRDGTCANSQSAAPSAWGLGVSQRAWKGRNDFNYQGLETKKKQGALPQTAVAAHHGEPTQSLKQLEKHEAWNSGENLTYHLTGF